MPISLKPFTKDFHLRRASGHPRNGRDRPPGRRCGDGQHGRHRRSVHRCRQAGAQARAGILPAHGRLRREDLCGRQDSRRLLQARRQALGEGNAHLAPDRPSDPAAVPRRLLQRDPGRRDGDVGQSGGGSGHPGDDRRVCGARRSPAFRSTARSAAPGSVISTASTCSIRRRPSSRRALSISWWPAPSTRC